RFTTNFSPNKTRKHATTSDFYRAGECRAQFKLKQQPSKNSQQPEKEMFFAYKIACGTGVFN
ncbi:hypothetical protein N9D63_05380, partial [Opitutales bacterium]|nr:hypothetical protein [Opitutales bacterium]